MEKGASEEIQNLLKSQFNSCYLSQIGFAAAQSVLHRSIKLYSRVPNTRGGDASRTLINFQKFHPPPGPFINFGETMSKAQYDFYTKFCSKDKAYKAYTVLSI